MNNVNISITIAKLIVLGITGSYLWSKIEASAQFNLKTIVVFTLLLAILSYLRKYVFIN